jgi:aldehyde dehydrogenase (NAD+)
MSLATPPVRPALFAGQTKLLIGNQWVESADGGTFETLNPATGETISHVCAASATDVDLAVKAARHALERGPWGKMEAGERGRLMFKLADLVERHTEELAQLETLNSGKTINDTRGDVGGVVATLRYYAGWADKIEGKTIPSRKGFFSYTLRQPVGVVGQIIPWNFPLLMLAWKWGPALACGNTIVMKPAEQTPLSALRMGELAIEAGFPAGVINLLNGYGETTGAAIVDHPGIDKLAFTGHVDTAKLIARNAANTLKRVTFELGGKSPNIVFADADLEAAVNGAYHAIYFNGGQCCTAGSRLFVEESIRPEFVARLAQKTKQRRLGSPLDTTVEQGPQVSLEQMNKILKYVKLGEEQGATLVAGGAKWGERGFFVEPTLFDNVTDQMAIATDEIFGPVVSVLPFSGTDDLIERANNTNYGLAAAVWTKDIDKAHRFAQQIQAGTVWINCYHIFDVTTPFGGFKQSGYGREKGEEALLNYTETKTVTIKVD